MFFNRKKQKQNKINQEVRSRQRSDRYAEGRYESEQNEYPWDFPGNNPQQDWDNPYQSVEPNTGAVKGDYQQNFDEDNYQGNHYMGPDYLADDYNPNINQPMEQDERYQVYYQDEDYEPMASNHHSGYSESPQQDVFVNRGKRAKYHAKIDQFLTNGIIIVGVLLLAVLLIAFLG